MINITVKYKYKGKTYDNLLDASLVAGKSLLIKQIEDRIKPLMGDIEKEHGRITINADTMTVSTSGLSKELEAKVKQSLLQK